MARKIILLFLSAMIIFSCKKDEYSQMSIIQEKESELQLQISQSDFSGKLCILTEMQEQGTIAAGLVQTVNDLISENLNRYSSLQLCFLRHRDTKTGLDENTAILSIKAKTHAHSDDINIMLALEKNNSVKLEKAFSPAAMEWEPIIFQISDQIRGIMGDPARSSLAAPSKTRNYYPLAEAAMHIQIAQHDKTGKAISILKNILKNDPDFVLAWLYLADAYLQIMELQWDRNLVWLQLAKECAASIKKIDPENAKASLIYGRIVMHLGDHKTAESHFKNAITLNPNEAAAWAGLGNVLSRYGLYQAALTAYNQALVHDPRNSIITQSKGLIMIGLKQYEDAEQFLSSFSINNDNKDIYTLIALSQYYQSNIKKAEQTFLDGITGRSLLPLDYTVHAMIEAKKGNLDEALYILEMHIKPSIELNANLAAAAAALHCLLGQNGSALEWLKKAMDLGYEEYEWLNNDPNFDGLRNNPEFENLLNDLKQLWLKRMDLYDQSIVVE